MQRLTPVFLHLQLAWFVELDLRNVTLVVQDWGGLTGLSALPNLRGRVSKLCIMNTGLPPVGFWYTSPRTAANFLLWRTLVKVTNRHTRVQANPRHPLSRR